MQQACATRSLRTVPMLRRLPRHIDRVFTSIERDGFRVRCQPLLRRARRTRRHHAREPRRARRLAGGAIGLVSVRSHRDRGRARAFSGDTSLFQVFGYFGLFCATVLAMRVIVAVLRDGLN